MHRRRFLASLSSLAALPLRAASPAQPLSWQEPHMGTLWTIETPGADPIIAARAAKAAFSRIAALNTCLSDYLPDSELSRLSASAGLGKPVPVSSDLWTVLSKAQLAAASSHGLFDITLGPLTALWRRSRRQQKLPDAAALAKARAASGWQFLTLNPDNQSALLRQPGMRLDAGGIAKGFAQDEALKVIASHGITSALINAGGEVGVSGPPPGRPAWLVQLQPVPGSPTPVAAVKSSCVATSGDLHQFVEIDGRRFSHIIDPATGLGMERPGHAVVIAPSGLSADVLATILCLMGPSKGIPWLTKNHPDIQARISQTNPDRSTETNASPGFSALLAPPAPAK